MPIVDHLRDHSGSWVEGWFGIPGLLLNPIYNTHRDNLFGRLYAAVVFEADRLRIDGPVIPVHAVISNEYVTSGDPEVVQLIRDEVLRLKKLNPNMSLEYEPEGEIQEQFRQSARSKSSPNK